MCLDSYHFIRLSTHWLYSKKETLLQRVESLKHSISCCNFCYEDWYTRCQIPLSMMIHLASSNVITSYHMSGLHYRKTKKRYKPLILLCFSKNIQQFIRIYTNSPIHCFEMLLKHTRLLWQNAINPAEMYIYHTYLSTRNLPYNAYDVRIKSYARKVCLWYEFDKLEFAVIYTLLEFRYDMSHTITSHHVHHFHQTRIPDGTLLDYMVQYRKPLFPQLFLYPKKFLLENNPHHKEFHLRP